MDYRLKDIIIKIIRNVLKLRSGENFKMHVPLADLIDYKMNEEDKLKKYICITKELEIQVKKGSETENNLRGGAEPGLFD